MLLLEGETGRIAMKLLIESNMMHCLNWKRKVSCKVLQLQLGTMYQQLNTNVIVCHVPKLE